MCSQKVLFTDAVRENLISVGRLCDAGYVIIFGKDGSCIVDEKTGELVHEGGRDRSGLYPIMLKTSKNCKFGPVCADGYDESSEAGLALEGKDPQGVGAASKRKGVVMSVARANLELHHAVEGNCGEKVACRLGCGGGCGNGTSTPMQIACDSKMRSAMVPLVCEKLVSDLEALMRNYCLLVASPAQLRLRTKPTLGYAVSAVCPEFQHLMICLGCCWNAGTILWRIAMGSALMLFLAPKRRARHFLSS